MSDAEREYLDDYLTGLKAKTDPDLEDEIFFERFCARQILKSRDIDIEELASGETRGEGDGGADSVYFFCEGKLVTDEMAPKEFERQGVRLQLILIQATRSASFNKDPIRKFEDMANDILDPAQAVDDHAADYNHELRTIAKRFRWWWTSFKQAAQAPELTIHYYYASKGDVVDPKVDARADQLKKRIQQFYACVCKFEFVNAKRLREMIHWTRLKPLDLNFEEKLESGKLGDAYVCLVSLDAFAVFITTPDHERREYLLDPNVRGYLGSNKVNKKIQETLAGKRDDQFWWLNNGVTIVASEVTLKTTHLKLTRPRIVNGLQTSREIYSYARDNQWNLSDDPRYVMVRIIEAADKELMNRIIKTTNSQTSVRQVYLHGTDDIQIKIEDAFPAHELYYERVKNQWVDVEKDKIPTGQIVTFLYLMKALIATQLLAPDQARGRPESYGDANYKKLFPKNRKPLVFANAAHLMLRTDEYLTKHDPSIERKDITNLRYYVAMGVFCLLSGLVEPSATLLGQIKKAEITDKVLANALALADKEYRHLIQKKKPGQTQDNDADKIAKGTDLVDRLKTSLEKELLKPQNGKP